MPVATIPDTTQPWKTVVAQSIPLPVSILFTRGGSKLVAGTNIEVATQLAIMPAYGFTPSMTDTVTRSDGSVLALESINPLSPNGQVIIWRLEFKQ
jgi:hypothetical protein